MSILLKSLEIVEQMLRIFDEKGGRIGTIGASLCGHF
jgi:hypothetical protein